MNGNLEELLAPPLAAVVFGYMSHLSFENGSVTMACTLAGYVVAQGFDYVKKHPPKSRGRLFANETRAPQSATFLLNDSDGFTARITGQFPFGYWQEIGKVVMEWNADNLTTQIIERALPNKTQAEQRAIHKQIVGLLKPDPIGVITVKGNHNVITYPKGRGFFARVSKGMVSPLEQDNIPYTPPQKMLPKNMDSKGHTRPTRAILNLGEAV